MIRKVLNNIRDILAIYLSPKVFVMTAELRRVAKATPLIGTLVDKQWWIQLPTDRETQNISILRDGDNWIAAVRVTNTVCNPRTCRYSIEGGKQNIDSHTWMVRLSEDFAVLDTCILADETYRGPASPAKNGLDDGRIFHWRGDVWGLWTATQILRDDWGSASNTMAIGKIRDCKIDELQFLPSPHGLPREKNWMPWVVGNQLRLIYDIRNFEVYSYDGGALDLLHKATEQDGRLKGWSGSSQVMPWGDDWICVIHYAARAARTGLAKLGNFFYMHRFLILTDDFQIKAISREFFFQSRGIEFCVGLAIESDRVVLSYCRKEAESHIMTLSHAEVESLF